MFEMFRIPKISRNKNSLCRRILLQWKNWVKIMIIIHTHYYILVSTIIWKRRLDEIYQILEIELCIINLVGSRIRNNWPQLKSNSRLGHWARKYIIQDSLKKLYNSDKCLNVTWLRCRRPPQCQKSPPLFLTDCEILVDYQFSSISLKL